MLNNIEMSLLFDFYKNLLTDKQRNIFDLYYNFDLSLAEIAEQLDISRQGVQDHIKRGEKIILDYEKKLNLYSKFSSINKNIEKLKKANEESDINKIKEIINVITLEIENEL